MNKQHTTMFTGALLTSSHPKTTSNSDGRRKLLQICTGVRWHTRSLKTYLFLAATNEINNQSSSSTHFDLLGVTRDGGTAPVSTGRFLRKKERTREHWTKSQIFFNRAKRPRAQRTHEHQKHEQEFSSTIRAGVSNSNCSVGHIRTYKETCGPHYNADATTTVCELTRKSFCIFISCERYHQL